MIGLMFLGFFAIYFMVSFLVVKSTVIWAKKRSRSAWGWGFLAAFFMYNLVFWDWIPTVFLHHQYCEFDGGTTVYKAPADWALDNPGLIGQLPRKKVNFRSTGLPNSFVDVLNDRVEFRTSSQMLWPEIKKMETTIFDTETQKPLIREIKYGSRCYQTDGISQYKVWMPPCGCGVVEQRPESIDFLLNEYTKIWEIK